MAVCIVVGRGLQPILLNRPTWATAFVKEINQPGGMISPDPKRQSARGATTLLVIFLVGLVLHLVTVFYPHPNSMAVAPAISWVIYLPKIKNLFDINIRPYSSFWLR